MPIVDGALKSTARKYCLVDYYGTDGVYIAFSGGKDSSVLLHIAREMYPKISAVYVDTGLEVREFVKRQENVETSTGRHRNALKGS